MKMVKLVGLVLVVALMVPVLASCYSTDAAEEPTGDTTNYYSTTQPVVVTKTVPVPAPAPSPKVVVVPRPSPNPPTPAHPNGRWHWPWRHHPHP
jgi:hypothetical protein